MDNAWSNVDRYITENLLERDAVLEEALRSNASANLPSIDVSPSQGKWLYLLTRVAKAARILEVGTLGGYSTIWLARALPPGGRLISLELEERHAAVARANIERAALTDRVEIRVGPALQSLDALERVTGAPFDLTFIDADKENNPHYFERAVRLSRAGSVIVVDNVVRAGRIVDFENHAADLEGTRALFTAIQADRRVTATALQTVGSKGHDGFLMAIVN